MIPYEKGTERLDYFHMRRYTLEAVMADDTPPVMEDLQRKKIFFVGNRQKTETGRRRTEVKIGNLCVNISTEFNDGVYVQDVKEPTMNLNGLKDDALALCFINHKFKYINVPNSFIWCWEEDM